MAHANLGTAFEGKGDVRGAIGEYRAAQTLDPENPTIRGNYERLLGHINE
jgi:Flp pilus assembly protein TadD